MGRLYWVEWQAYRIQDWVLEAERLLSEMCKKCDKIRQGKPKDKECLECHVEKALQILDAIHNMATDQIRILHRIRRGMRDESKAV